MNYLLETTNRTEVSTRCYSILAILAITWLVVAAAVNPAWLWAPFEPWVRMASRWSSVRLEFPSAATNILMGFVFLLLGWLATVAYLMLVLTPLLRVIGSFGEYAIKKFSVKTYWYMLTAMAIVTLFIGSTAW